MALSPVEQFSTLSSEVASKISRRKLSRSALAPHERDKRYIRRDERGRINESEDVSRSLSGRAQTGEGVSQPGQADKGDRQPRKL